ncbi:MAG: hypothetical protein E7L17_05665 [Clostridium sp.]|uniref:hypothetical protein n=1 Tax=Clostridium sp. TaxID=1506 RepID=UPI0029093D02|nr:hypothetical protein [Clostridium sp.]MDU7337587.1 hypothetical protein [Clostridium sp.]
MFYNEGDNNGNQYNAGRDIIITSSNSKKNPQSCLNDLCEVRQSGTMIGKWIAAVVSLIANIVTILVAFNDLKIIKMNGYFPFMNRLQIWLIIEGILIIIFMYFVFQIFYLLKNNITGKLIRKRKEVIKIIPKACPTCGETLGGKLKCIHENGEIYFECNKSSTHRWNFDITELLKNSKDK